MNSITETSNPVFLNPRKLRPHPARAMMPEMPVETIKASAFLADVENHGIHQPVLVDSLHRYVDGERRVVAAVGLELDEVACVVLDDNAIVSTILSNLVQRRHLTKSALAYSVFPLLEPALEEARQYKLDCLKKGDNAPVVHSVDYGAKTAEELAAQIGFSRAFFFYAAEVHKHCAQDETLRKAIEESLFINRVGLGAIVAGLAGRSATKDQPRPETKQLILFQDGFNTLTKRFKYWESFTPAERKEAAKAAQSAILEMPEDLQEVIRKSLT